MDENQAKARIARYFGDHYLFDYGYDVRQLLILIFDDLAEIEAFKSLELLSPGKTAKKVHSVLSTHTNKKKDKYRNYVLTGAVLHQMGLLKFRRHRYLKNISKKEMYGRICKYLNTK